MGKIVTLLLPIFLMSGCALMFDDIPHQATIISKSPEAKIHENDSYLVNEEVIAVFKEDKNDSIGEDQEGCNVIAIPDFSDESKLLSVALLFGVFVNGGVVHFPLIDGLVTGSLRNFDQASHIHDGDCTI
ncbi:hypothetical protein [Veronia pacifica]|uniref:Lipoprotein n=1 Tax=Veronia pacifica TaxID=1080227 RepID=A0A1C3EL64_9GAMM|nr:hypothetical protein [Veronia pacifica]ODA33972.1 hypothetical protein A8L45_07950 [Veronia pacifica]